MNRMKSVVCIALVLVVTSLNVSADEYTLEKFKHLKYLSDCMTYADIGQVGKEKFNRVIDVLVTAPGFSQDRVESMRDYRQGYLHGAEDYGTTSAEELAKDRWYSECKQFH